jgi:hypothetical protein
MNDHLWIVPFCEERDTVFIRDGNFAFVRRTDEALKYTIAEQSSAGARR